MGADTTVGALSDGELDDTQENDQVGLQHIAGSDDAPSGSAANSDLVIPEERLGRRSSSHRTKKFR